jgi:hypothetical protein
MPFEIPGLVIPFQEFHLLVYGPDAAALGAPVLGPLVHLWPAYHLWDQPDYVLPTTVVDDIGQEFGAPDCYEWLETQGDLFPRSDVMGWLASGPKASVFTKQLDLTYLFAFASSTLNGGPFTKLDLVVEARAVADDLALTPIPCPWPLFERALPSYRLAPGVFGAVGASILSQLLTSGRRDWRLTFDQVDDLVGLP